MKRIAATTADSEIPIIFNPAKMPIKRIILCAYKEGEIFVSDIILHHAYAYARTSTRIHDTYATRT